MGIYIKDMDMPSYCEVCPFRHENRYSYHEYCSVNEQRIWEDKPDWCPLIFIEDKDETNEYVTKDSIFDIVFGEY